MKEALSYKRNKDKAEQYFKEGMRMLRINKLESAIKFFRLSSRYGADIANRYLLLLEDTRIDNALIREIVLETEWNLLKSFSKKGGDEDEH